MLPIVPTQDQSVSVRHAAALDCPLLALRGPQSKDDSDMNDQPDKDSADTDDTMQAPPSEEPETAIVASDTSTADRRDLAWSLDETDEIQPTGRGRIVSAVLIALLAGIVA